MAIPVYHRVFVYSVLALCPLRASTDPVEFFKTRIRPVLESQCFACHTAARMGGLEMDSLDRLLKGGNSGPAVVPGDPDTSLLIRAVTYTHERFKMPPPGKLKDEVIADLRTWVKEGAHWDSTVPPPTESAFTITPQQKAFWSFRPLNAHMPPEVKNKAWAKSPIDRFILAKLEAQGLDPVQSADKRTLLRRATFDLTGLPPTPAETDTFVNDPAPDAFAKAIDRLLSSPQFGERWGRHWLDVARYGEDDAKRPGLSGYVNAWRYRDWVIAAFNRDMPYDLFVKAQIAGDLLEDESSLALKPGLGFFALGPWPYDNIAAPSQRANERDVKVDGLSRAFLGLTVACARCHDHKLDPISSKDYYALAGVFASTDYREYPLVPKSVVEADARQKALVRQIDTTRREFLETIRRQVAEIQTRKIARFMVAAWKVMGPSNSAAAEVAGHDQLDQFTLQRWVTYLGKTERAHPYLKAWDEMMARGATEPEVRQIADAFEHRVLAMLAEKKRNYENNQRILIATAKASTKILGPNGYKGYECNDCDLLGEGIAPDLSLLWRDLYVPFGEKGIFHYDEPDLAPFLHPEWKQHLAELKAEADAARKAQPKPFPFVMGLAEGDAPVNLKVDQRGNALQTVGEEVPRRFLTVLSTQEPAPFRKGSGRLELAQAILDHPLAARVMANRIWQHLFGEGIVRTPSNFGQLGDRPSHPELLDYLAGRLRANHWSTKGLIREIMLSAAYQLGSETPAKNQAQDPENRLVWRMNRKRLDVESLRDSLLWAGGNLDLEPGGPSAALDEDNLRRTVYAEVSRYKLDPGLALFDFPDPGHSSEKRTLTNIPIQGLFFLNSDLMLAQAEALAERLEREAGPDDTAKIKRAYRVLYARDADNMDLEAGMEYLNRLRTGNSEKSSIWPKYAQVLLSALEFRYVD